MGLAARRPLVVGALAATASVAAIGASWMASAPQPLEQASTQGAGWDLDSAEAALSEGRLVLAQLVDDVASEKPAPTLAEVIDLPIRRVATTRVTRPPEIAVAPQPAPEPAAPAPPSVPSPDLAALLAPAPSPLFPAPAARVPVRYASLPDAAVPEKFAIRLPQMPLLVRLEAPPPLAGAAARWEGTASDPDPDAGGSDAAGPDARDADAAVAIEDAPLVPPPPRPAGLPAGAPQPAGAPATPEEPPAGAPARTLAGLLRAVLGGDGMPGVTEASDGRTPTACLPAPLRTILADVAREFGEVTLVSTEFLNTGNHYVGSARDRFHRDCEAADFRVDADPARVVGWLRGRPDVGGVAAYRNGVIHVDLDRAVAARLRRDAAAR